MADIVLGPGQNIWLYYDPGREAWTSFVTGHTSGGLSGGLSGSANESITGQWTFSGIDKDGLNILDTNESHALKLLVGSNLTAARTLTLTTGDADRTLTISGNATVSQDYSITGSPTFAAMATTGNVTVGDQLHGTAAVTGNVLGGAGNSVYQFRITGTLPANSDNALFVDSTVSPTAGSSGGVWRMNPNIVEAGSGNHPLLCAIQIGPGTVTSGAATVGSTAAIYIADVLNGGGVTVTGGQYAIFSDAGLNRFDGNGTHVFELPADATDPTGGGGAATGRIPVTIGGATRYLAYY